MTRTSLAALAVTITALTGACARVVVVEPAKVGALNDTTWTVRTPTAKTPAPSPGGGAREVVSPLPSASAPAQPSPSAAIVPAIDTRLEAALASPRGADGIPVGLYDYDPMLWSYLEVAQARASSHRRMGAGILIYGIVTGALAGYGFHWAEGQTINTETSLSLFGLATIATVSLITGLVEVATRTDRQALKRYVRETYDVQ